jgi:hypothetical protein
MLEKKRCKIFNSLCKYAEFKSIDVKVLILVPNGNGKNALQIANENCSELYQEMKRIFKEEKCYC